MILIFVLEIFCFLGKYNTIDESSLATDSAKNNINKSSIKDADKTLSNTKALNLYDNEKHELKKNRQNATNKSNLYEKQHYKNSKRNNNVQKRNNKNPLTDVDNSDGYSKNIESVTENTDNNQNKRYQKYNKGACIDIIDENAQLQTNNNSALQENDKLYTNIQQPMHKINLQNDVCAPSNQTNNDANVLGTNKAQKKTSRMASNNGQDSLSNTQKSCTNEQDNLSNIQNNSTDEPDNCNVIDETGPSINDIGKINEEDNSSYFGDQNCIVKNMNSDTRRSCDNIKQYNNLDDSTAMQSTELDANNRCPAVIDINNAQTEQEPINNITNINENGDGVSIDNNTNDNGNENNEYDWSPRIRKVVIPGKPRVVCIVKVIPVPVTKDGKLWNSHKNEDATQP